MKITSEDYSIIIDIVRKYGEEPPKTLTAFKAILDKRKESLPTQKEAKANEVQLLMALIKSYDKEFNSLEAVKNNLLGKKNELPEIVIEKEALLKWPLLNNKEAQLEFYQYFIDKGENLYQQFSNTIDTLTVTSHLAFLNNRYLQIIDNIRIAYENNFLKPKEQTLTKCFDFLMLNKKEANNIFYFAQQLLSHDIYVGDTLERMNQYCQEITHNTSLSYDSYEKSLLSFLNQCENYNLSHYQYLYSEIKFKDVEIVEKTPIALTMEINCQKLSTENHNAGSVINAITNVLYLYELEDRKRFLNMNHSPINNKYMILHTIFESEEDKLDWKNEFNTILNFLKEHNYPKMESMEDLQRVLFKSKLLDNLTNTTLGSKKMKI